MSILDDVQFWATVIEESRRTLICHPKHEAAIRARADELGVGGMLTVQTSALLPTEDTLILMDEGALQAATAEAMQSLTRRF
jgi:hypothetical protein